MSRVFQVSPSARADVQEIAGYIRAHTGPLASAAVLKRLRAKFELVRRTPFAGAPRPELGDAVRSVVSQRWVVYYVVTDDLCRILRVLDGARDVGATFARD